MRPRGRIENEVLAQPRWRIAASGWLRQGHDAVQRIHLGGFPAAPHKTEGHQGGFLVSAGDGAQARQDERGGLPTRLVRPSEPSRLTSRFSDTIDSLFIARVLIDSPAVPDC